MTGSTATPGKRPGQGKATDAKAPPPIRRLEVDTLLGGGRECIIVHGDAEYRLRVTSAGKLILTK